ncbi:MAG: hypothetical protein IKT37_05010 [Clostridia bacterium]|nr:hypothetical protein [Clostridia bacterium]
MIDRFERFTIGVMEIFRYWHKITAGEMEKLGLKGAYCTYFSVLARFEEGVTATQLGELCCKDKADVSRAVSELEKRGYVTKETNGSNLYRAKICLTQAGRQVAEYVQQRANLAVSLAGEGVSEQDREIFYSTFQTIAENLEKISLSGLPEDK